MNKRWAAALFVIFALTGAILFPAIRPAFASNTAADLPPCSGAQVAGTVVAVDETTQTVTIHTASGLCTVTLHASDPHSIAGLLGQYFGDISASSLTGALAHTQGCIVLVNGAWTWSDCDAPGAVHVTIYQQNPDGTFNAWEAGKTEPVVVVVGDAALANEIVRTLAGLNVTWDMNEDGSVASAAEEIERYHSEEGLGYGVLVKLYAMAAEAQTACQTAEGTGCGATAAELVAKFQSGVGIGQLFKEYGKPEVVGVGQVRNQDKMKDKDKYQDEETGENQPGNYGQEQDKPQNHANPNAPGQNKDKPDKPGKNK